MKVAVLGRDGVINQLGTEADWISQAQDWKALPGSLEAIAKLNRGGFHVVIATNQQGLARKARNVEALHDIHDRMLRMIQEAGGTVDGIFFATSGNKEGHGLNQPKAKLIDQVRRRFSCRPQDMVIIGDSRADIEAAAMLGIQAILLRTGKGSNTLKDLEDFDGVTVYSNLANAVDALV